MERIVERNMLYDFYGELLTPHQQEVYEAVIFQDLSLSEVAELHGISRQGVHDLVKRCDRLLEGYEGRLHLVERFIKLKSSVGDLQSLIGVYAQRHDDGVLERINGLCQMILEEL